MEEHSGTRSGAVATGAARQELMLSLKEWLYRVIRSDIESGALPAGALLPVVGTRRAGTRAPQETEVQSALARLLVEGLLRCATADRFVLRAKVR